MKGPKLSILTPSYQQGRYLEQNILSVQRQPYQPIEHIVIDGGSTDCTLGLLRKYPHVRWVSEPDEGQADALNKGLAMATGEIVGWLNSDDYYNTDVFPSIMKAFEDPEVLWVIGNIAVVYEGANREVRTRSPAVTCTGLRDDPDIVRQQGAFFRREFLDLVGKWDKRFHMAMDYDLWLRMSKISPPKMVDEYWACFRIQQGQKTGARNVLRQLREILPIMKREGAPLGARARVVGSKLRIKAKLLVKTLAISCHLIHPRFAYLPFRSRNW